MSRTSRRALMALSAGGGLTLFFGGCGQQQAASPVCYDASMLTTSQIQKRELLKYVDASPDPQKICSGCENFSPDAQNTSCGACSSLGGPVEPGGHCNAWRARA